MVRRALQALQAGHLDEAEHLVAAAIADDPTSIAALHVGGLVAHARGEHATAVARLRRAADLAPDHAALAVNLGHALAAHGAEDGALAAYERARKDPSVAAHAALGVATLRRRRGELEPAIAAYASALEAGLETVEVWNGLGLALAEDGRLVEAEIAYRSALSVDDRVAAVHVNLGNALADQGRAREAIAAFEAAIELDPREPAAWFDLFAARWDDAPAAAEACLVRALDARADHVLARFHLGAIAALRGDHERAAPLLEGTPEHLASSLAFVLALEPRPRLFANGFRVLEAALAESKIDGLVLELGVRRGVSIDFLAARVDGLVHGFDSFEGLPTEWGARPVGAYTTRGELPAVRENVRLHVGWFRDTLGPFVAEHPGPIRFVNVDCDLYASTRDAFAILAPRFVPGTVLVFDEYLCNPGWQDEEHRALVEAAAEHGFAYDTLMVSLFSRQLVARVR